MVLLAITYVNPDRYIDIKHPSINGPSANHLASPKKYPITFCLPSSLVGYQTHHDSHPPAGEHITPQVNSAGPIPPHTSSHPVSFLSLLRLRR